MREAVVQIGGEWYGGSGCQLARMLQRGTQTQAAISQAHDRGTCAAGSSQGLSAGFFKHQCRANIPRVGHLKNRLCVVKLCEAAALRDLNVEVHGEVSGVELMTT